MAGRAGPGLPAKVGRKSRTAQMAICFTTASLARPRNGLATGRPKSVTMTVVDVREVDAPEGETPVHWRLLTTHAVADTAEVLAVAALYRRR